MNIDIKKELGVIEPVFIKKKEADKFASAERLAITEKFFEQWHSDINRTNTSEMPTKLMAEYENACMCLCKILMYEKEILNRSE